MKIFADLEAQTRQNFYNLFLVSLLFWLSITSLLPILPAYVNDIGGTKQEVGYVMGAFAIGLLASRTFLGKIADQKGRKNVVLIGTFVVALAPLGYLLIKTVEGLILIRAFHGISIAAFTIGYSALIVDLSPPQRRGELVGYMSLALPIGMTLAPAIGSLLQEKIDYWAVFTFCHITGLISCLLTLKVKENYHHHDQKNLDQNKQFTPRKFQELLLNLAFSIPTFVLLMTGSIFGILITFLPLFIRELNFEFNAGLFYTIAAIASFVIRILTGKASDQIGRGRFITIGIICFSLAMFLLSIANAPIYLILAAIFEGISAGILIPLIVVLISDRCHFSERGKVYALCLGGYDLGIAIAGPIGGYFAEKISYSLLFLIAGGLNLIALLIFVTQSNQTIINSLKFSLGFTKDYYTIDN